MPWMIRAKPSVAIAVIASPPISSDAARARLSSIAVPIAREADGVFTNSNALY